MRIGGRRPGRRKWFLGAALVAVVALVWFWAGGPAPPPPKPAPPPEAPAKMETLSLTEMQDGDKRWKLEAKKADFLKDRLEIHLSCVEVEFFSPKGEPVKIKCQEGVIHTKTRVLTLKGGVELDFRDLQIRTELVTYNPAGRILLAPAEVTLAGERLKVQGKGLQVNLADRKLTLSQHHLTQLQVQGGELKP